jgi:hypothetical protein
MDIHKQADEIAFKHWVVTGEKFEAEKPEYDAVAAPGFSSALMSEDDEDRRDFFEEILDAVMPINTGGWSVAAVYLCETSSPIETFVVVIWRIKSGNITKTLIEFKAFLLQWDEDNDQYIIAKNRKL